MPRSYNNSYYSLGKPYSEEDNWTRNITQEELRQRMLESIFNEMEEHCKIAHFRGMYFQIEAAKKIVEDKSIIDREIDFIKLIKNSYELIYYKHTI